MPLSSAEQQTIEDMVAAASPNQRDNMRLDAEAGVAVIDLMVEFWPFSRHWVTRWVTTRGRRAVPGLLMNSFCAPSSTLLWPGVARPVSGL